MSRIRDRFFFLVPLELKNDVIVSYAHACKQHHVKYRFLNYFSDDSAIGNASDITILENKDGSTEFRIPGCSETTWKVARPLFPRG